MFVNWLRKNVFSAGLLTVIRLYLGWQWMTAGWGKIKGGFDAGGFLNGAVAKATGDNPVVQSWWGSFLDGFAIPNVELFNILVPWGEFLVGIALLLGLFTTFSALMGIIMNFAFLFSGTISSNPNMAILTVILLVAGANASKFGLDYYVLPQLRNLFNKKSVTQPLEETS